MISEVLENLTFSDLKYQNIHSYTTSQVKSR